MILPKIVLGTGSKRRIEIFSSFSLPFTATHSSFDEDSVSTSLTPERYVLEVAKGKALILANDYPECLVLTADTTVYFENAFYNKPKDSSDALQTLLKLQNRPHEVWTGVVLCYKGKSFEKAERTLVHMNPLSKDEAKKYIEAYNPIDKAGSYSIQDGSSILVKGIEGDYNNVLGFPISVVQELLNKVGIDLWQYLKTSC